MGLFLLVLFVGGSLAFALRAWASYDEEPNRAADDDFCEGDRQEETPLLVALSVVTLLSSFPSELLRHAFKLPFVQAFVISVACVATGEWLAIRFFEKKHGGPRDARDTPRS